MTEQNTSGAVVALPSIGDSAVLAEILMYTGRDAIAVMLNEQGDPNDFSRIVFGVASIFMGHTDSLELPEGWDPAARLKTCPRRTAGPSPMTRVSLCSPS